MRNIIIETERNQTMYTTNAYAPLSFVAEFLTSFDFILQAASFSQRVVIVSSNSNYSVGLNHFTGSVDLHHLY